MNNRPLRAVALLLAFLFALPTQQLVALAQEPAASGQEKPKDE